MTRDIAIIGMSVELPQAKNTDEFWDMVVSGKSASKPFPEGRRKDILDYTRYARTVAVKPLTDPSVDFHDGYWLDDIAQFDHEFFGMTPRQGAMADPVQRMLMKNAYLSLEDAGYSGPRIRDLRTGVFVGYSVNPGQTYADFLTRADPSLTPLTLTGNMGTMLANRISYQLDLHGPSMVVNSACSATLVALHQAKNALLTGDCDMAVVAGARIILSPVKSTERNIGIESSDGLTRPFDEHADGTGFGEGSGAVVLTRLDRARERGDQIYATIKGSAVNHDGHSEMITSPDEKAQTQLLLDAWADAGLDPRSLEYVEVHGTATRIGDPIEFEGLREAFGRHTSDKQFCAVGTAKANVGHLFEGSGVIGVIKAALTVKNKTVPPMANFEKPNPKIDFANGPIRVPTTAEPWNPVEGERHCGVSAFGIGGTNCHVVLGEAPQQYEAAAPEAADGPQIFTLSAHSERSLRLLVDAYVRHLGTEAAEQLNLRDVCYTTRVSRGAHRYRLALPVSSLVELRDALTALSQGSGDDLPALHSNLDDWSRPAQPDDSPLARYVRGEDVVWEEYEGAAPGRIVKLPLYAFDESRCWSSFPESWSERTSLGSAPSAQNHPVTHDVVFPEEPLAADWPGEVRALALVDPATEAEALLGAPPSGDLHVLRLVADGADVAAGTFAATDESLQEVAEHILRGGYTHIVHALALEETEAPDVQTLDHRVTKNLYSLFLLSKALMNSGVRARIVALTRNACALEDGASVTAPENSALAGLAKVIGREFPYLKTRVQDVDEHVTPDLLWREMTRPEPGLHLLREGRSYQEVFEELPELGTGAEEDYLKAGGTYLVTGGTGGIGLAVADMFATLQPDIDLVLLSRSGAPDRAEWEQLIAAPGDAKPARVARALAGIESKGARVHVHCVDAGDPDALRAVVEDVQRTFGRIDGIVHAAGIPGRNRIALRDPQDFADVVRPKIHGAYVLNSATADASCDFILYFSSVAVVFPSPGQGDYAAGNYYLDTLARMGRSDDCHVVAVDWVAWREVGMAVDYGSNLDTTFKAVYTDAGLDIIDKMLRSRRRRAFAGEVNYDGSLVHIFKSFDTVLGDTVSTKMKQAESELRDRLRIASEQKRQQIDAISVEVTGRPDGVYRDEEITVARCFADALGYPTVDVEADFFNMGGDSLMATSVASNIATCLQIEFDAADLLMERTVSAVADAVELMREEAEEESPV
ncbi:SDR family NAD(P)-dependent oxidoreductase [Streptomyces sp. NRRL S-646]|uniref:SDR family NAD(P)-dependent oxidoreductase n=1 Tax=Streptomyces sp. NRRL S-646 TaxID=1463917 RepID=UPI0004C8EA0E|nr:SDR family NAD(P)-dependent oxidoreductase [Streptomyces sp. NRRL S-646]